jgi:hypothetical protein
MKKIFFISFIFFGSMQLSADYKEGVKFPTVSFDVAKDERFALLQRNCQWCHSFGYVTNQGNQSYEFWKKVIVKMRDVYKAPILEKDEKIMTEYLFEHFGNGERK